MQSGIYAIRNLVTGDCYIGSTINFRERWNCHRCDLRNKVHHNRHLTGAWHKHGEANFVFEVLEQCEEAVLIVREQHWLDAANSTPRIVTYNLSPIADHRRREMPDAEREQKRQRLLGNLNTYGRVRPQNERDRISAGNRGKVRSQEAIENYRRAAQAREARNRAEAQAIPVVKPWEVVR